MKKIVLLFLLMISNIVSNNAQNIHVTCTYKDIPEWAYRHDALMQTMIICAAYSAKFMPYSFDHLDYDDHTVFAAYNNECSFFIRFHKESHDCEIEFNADDDSFDYFHFKKIMDSYFLYN